MHKPRFKISKKSRKKLLWLMPLSIGAVVLIYNAFILITWVVDHYAITTEIAQLNETTEIAEVVEGEPVNPPKDNNDNDYWNFMKMSLLNVDIAELKKQNPDTVGFISVAGTNINYPVVQTGDNDYYLHHSFKKSKNNAGWVFMDHRNSAGLTDQNTVIYGHSRLGGTMFSTLKNILNSSWVDVRDNHVVRYVSETETMLFQVFSVYTVPVESYYIQTRFGNDAQYRGWANEMIGRSKYDFRTSVDENDQVLTLSTCHNDNSVRVVMQAKLIKKNSL
ncbi:class B sortase [Candidatus Saccharibacteria bacterium]|nr:class B sortase [Candidatus Saccharibacteria bacterium]